MNRSFGLWGSIVILLLAGCRQPVKKEPSPALTGADSIVANTPGGEQERLHNRENAEEQARKDSMHLDMAYAGAMQVIKAGRLQKDFSSSFEFYIDSSNSVTVSLVCGKLFSPKRRHLIMRRRSMIDICIDIFLVEKDSLLPALSYRDWSMAYLTDTIQDVNGDGQKDFLVNWYGVTGCCLRNAYEVFLSHTDSTRFTGRYHFLNPTFSSREKLVRGVLYGQPGTTALYKCRWRGYRLDTVEFIYPDKRTKGQYIKTVHQQYLYDGKTGTVLRQLPKEYRNIFGYDWFLGDI